MCKVLLGVHNLFHRIIEFTCTSDRVIIRNVQIAHRRQVCMARTGVVATPIVICAAAAQMMTSGSVDTVI